MMPKFVTLNTSLAESIRKSMELNSKPFLSEVIDPKRVTECPRRLYYCCSGHLPEKPQSCLEGAHNEYMKQKWLHIFAKSSAITIMDKNVSVSDCNYNLAGLIDVVVKLDEEILLVTFYSVVDADFQMIRENGAFKKHVIEVMINAWLMERGKGILFYENRNTGEYLIYHVDIFSPIIDTVEQKCLQMMGHKLTGKIPLKPYKNKLAKECKICEFATKCWQIKGA